MPNLVPSLAITCATYLFLGIVVAVLLARYVAGHDATPESSHAAH